MEEIDKGKLNRKHFSKLHDKIQSKFEEMQRKLQKSKSVDSLSSLKEDYDYKEDKYGSNVDIREMPQQTQNLIQNAIIEEQSDVNIQFVSVKQLHASESELSLNEDEAFENSFFEFSRASLESLNEVANESDEYILPSPSPTISIRDKIGLRISAAKDKRRQKKERNEAKAKMKESTKKVEKFVLTNSPKQDTLKALKKTKVATVNIALIEATGLETDISEDRTRLLFCRFKLGNEKYKSKVIKSNTSKVKWQELFNFTLYEDNMVEVSLWDKDNCIGRTFIDLTGMEKERTHKMHLSLDSGEYGGAQIFILLTITGISLINTLMDLDDYQITQNRISNVQNHPWYGFKSSDAPSVGFISIIVFGAKGLSSNDCYCVLEINNERLQTDTEFKTNEPNWMKIFNFEVTDITSIIYVTVHDEKKSEDIAKLSIPLLDVISGQKKWYALKDPTLREKARGNNPRILLEMKLTWDIIGVDGCAGVCTMATRQLININHHQPDLLLIVSMVKASMRVINPKEPLLLETKDKVDRHIFARNLSRAKIVLNWALDVFKVIKTCFEWESRKHNIIALILWLLFCWFFKIWMVPLLLLIPFIWNRVGGSSSRLNNNSEVNQNQIVKKDEEEKKSSLRQKLQNLQDMVQSVQNFLGEFANLGESIKNLFNFTVPFLSRLTIFMIVFISFVMFLVPTNYIFMIWGIHKFTRKMLRPNRIPNNEILDLLSRVPNDEVLLDCAEVPLEEIPEEDVIR